MPHFWGGDTESEYTDSSGCECEKANKNNSASKAQHNTYQYSSLNLFILFLRRFTLAVC
jgi:hypothetical protein